MSHPGRSELTVLRWAYPKARRFEPCGPSGPAAEWDGDTVGPIRDISSIEDDRPTAFPIGRLGGASEEAIRVS